MALVSSSAALLSSSCNTVDEERKTSVSHRAWLAAVCAAAAAAAGSMTYTGASISAMRQQHHKTGTAAAGQHLLFTHRSEWLGGCSAAVGRGQRRQARPPLALLHLLHQVGGVPASPVGGTGGEGAEMVLRTGAVARQCCAAAHAAQQPNQAPPTHSTDRPQAWATASRPGARPSSAASDSVAARTRRMSAVGVGEGGRVQDWGWGRGKR